MSHPSGIPYNNRFRSSCSECNNHATAVAGLHLLSVSESVDMFGHPPSSGTQIFPVSPDQERRCGHVQKMTSFEQPNPVTFTAEGDPCMQVFSQNVGDVSQPMSPGKPRRLSRQISADAKRQLFASSKTTSREGGQVVTSIDSVCDDVFVEVAGQAGQHHHHYTLPDTSLFRSKRTVEVTSTSSTTSILPNPYNRINHRIHSTIWCCSCFYFVFFCCLPAIHYMEQCDVEFSKNNQKRAKCLGRTASFLFFTGTLITLSVLALIFFFAIFFAVY